MSEYFDMEALDDSGDDEYFDMEALDGTSFHLRVKNIVDLSASLFSGAITVFFVRSSVQGCWGNLSILCVRQMCGKCARAVQKKRSQRRDP